MRLDTQVNHIPAGILYLQLDFRFSNFHAAFYQKQQSAWHLVRTRAYTSLR